MKIKNIFLASSSVLVLSAVGALADNNEAWLIQNGIEQNALVTQQAGNDNDAGASGSELTQNGHRNDLTILQSGDGNAVGLGVNSVTGAQGVIQTHNGTPSGSRRGNILSITQSSDGNTVGSVDQRSSTQGGFSRNSATILQAGAGGNEIDSVRQSKGSSTRNVLNATQDGGNNLIATVWQQSGLGGNGVNTVNVYMAGTDNGRGALNGFAAASGATTSSLLQDGRGNSMDLVINGRPSIPVADENQYGITQIGLDNTVGQVTLNSKRANLGIYQSGNNNEVALSTIEGNDNTVGIRQMQNDNLAQVSIMGNGVGNSFFVDQDGTGNSSFVTIEGSNNGDGLVFGDPLAGSALTVSLVDAAWERGVVRQLGDANLADLSQFGNGNMFGTLQRGAGNSIVGVQDGNTNQVAVAQIGNGNASNYSQTGNGNNAGISQ